MRTFAIANLRATDVTETKLPWGMEVVVPDKVSNKKWRQAWINEPTTQHHCYSFVEGLNPGLRVSKGAKGEDGNPPYRIHAFVADYDAPASDASVLEGAERATKMPTFCERTLSGNARMVWLFERPVMVSSHALAVEYLQLVASRLKADTAVLPGYDKKSTEPSQYWTNSGSWGAFDGAKPLPADLTEGWLVEAVKESNHCGTGKVVEVPMDVAAGMLREKYPRFAEWRSDFQVGAQGPSFWVEGSSSPASALVKPDGIFTFSAHAVKSFYSWADLLGAAAMEEFTTRRIGSKLADYYFDGVSYWCPHNGTWISNKRPDVLTRLKVMGVSTKPDDDGITDLDRALDFINREGRIEGVRTTPYIKAGITIDEGKRYLQITTTSVLPPADGPVTWGPGGKIEFISAILERLLTPLNPQLDVLLSWLSLAYKGGYERCPQQGQALILIGGASAGKTLVNKRIIGAVLGGDGDACEFLMGNDSFGGELFSKPLWRIDDAVSGTDVASHRRFTEKLKAAVANPWHRVHNKFEKPVYSPWKGRVVATFNDDAESIACTPDFARSTGDKFLVLRALSNGDPNWFPNPKVTEARIAQELPYFARYLLDYQIPSTVVLDSRYGIRAYHDSETLADLHASSESSQVWELVDKMRMLHFKQNPGQEYWTTCSTELYSLLSDNPETSGATRGMTCRAFSRHMSTLASRTEAPFARKRVGGKTFWIIKRPADLEPTKEVLVKI